MQVGDDLAGGGAVGLVDVDAVGAESFDLGAGDAADDGDHLGQDVVGGVGEGVVVGLGNDEGMAGNEGADIHEGEHVVILVEAGGGDVAGDDFAEEAVGHGVGCSIGGV